MKEREIEKTAKQRKEEERETKKERNDRQTKKGREIEREMILENSAMFDVDTPDDSQKEEAKQESESRDVEGQAFQDMSEL